MKTLFAFSPIARKHVAVLAFVIMCLALLISVLLFTSGMALAHSRAYVGPTYVGPTSAQRAYVGPTYVGPTSSSSGFISVD